MCGGVIYESLVQSLAVEGINLPPYVVQRGIERNILHLDVGSEQIRTRRQQKRIATTFPGNGPRGFMELRGISLDGYLMRAAVAGGAQHIRARVAELAWSPDMRGGAGPGGRLVQLRTQAGNLQTYEVVVARMETN